METAAADVAAGTGVLDEPAAKKAKTEDAPITPAEGPEKQSQAAEGTTQEESTAETTKPDSPKEVADESSANMSVEVEGKVTKGGASQDEAPSTGWIEVGGGAAVDAEIDEADAKWILEEHSRSARLARLADANLAMVENKPILKPSGAWLGGSSEWAEQICRAMCALRFGQHADLLPISEFQSHKAWHPPLTVMAIPKSEVSFLKGRDGARLRTLSDELDVIAVFVKARTAAREVPGLVVEIGSLVEARYGKTDRFFEATIVKIGSRKVSVRWAYDDSVPESQVLHADLRPLADSNESNEEVPKEKGEVVSPIFAVGDLVEAFFAKNKRWFEAKIVEKTKSGFIVKWTYDDDVPEAEVAESDVRTLPQSGDVSNAKEELPVSKYVVGQLVEGFFAKNKRWFEAKVIKITKKGFLVKWTYDDDVPETDLGESEMRPILDSGQMASEGKSSSSVFAVGDLVEGFFAKNKRWFEAKIVKATRKGFRVKWTYDDDVPETELGMSDIRALPNSGTKQPPSSSPYAVGDLVEGFFAKNKRWFEAKILRTTRKGFLVKWTYDDDVPESELTEKEIRPSPGSSKSVEKKRSDAEYNVGDLVEAFFEKNKRWFEAKIVKITRKGFLVKWTYDEKVPESEVTEKNIRPPPGSSAKSEPEASYIVGDLVEAFFAKNGRWFEARIVQMSKRGAIVKWTYDDHVPETQIAMKDIRPLPNSDKAVDKENQPTVIYEAGDYVEVFYPKNGRWFEAKIVGMTRRGAIVKFTYDDDIPEAQVPLQDLRPISGSGKTPKEETLPSSDFEVGDLVEAFFSKNGRWFEAEIMELMKKAVIVKWTYDDKVPATEVARKDLRPLPHAKQSHTSEKSTPPPEISVGDIVDAKFTDPTPGFKVGDLVTAKYGKKERYFEAVILKVFDKSLRVKWTYDEKVPEDEVSFTDVKDTLATSKKKDRWLPAKVLKVGTGALTVKWTHDDTAPEAQVSMTDVKTRPVLETDEFHIYGEKRSRLTAEVRLLNLVEGNIPGYVDSSSRISDTCEGVGISVVPLHKAGELKAKLIGKAGSMRLKISRACESSLEYVGVHAYIAGTLKERTQTIAVLDLVQTEKTGDVEGVPEVLEDICTRLVIPQAAIAAVQGVKRVTLYQLEEELGFLSFFLPEAASQDQDGAARPSLQLSDGMTIEGKIGKRWFEGTILGITPSSDGARTVRVRWASDSDEEAEIPESDIREVGASKPDENAEGARTLAIVGQPTTRKIAEMRIAGTVERQCPGSFSSLSFAVGGDAYGDACASEGWGVQILTFSRADIDERCQEERRKAIAGATNCAVEQIGDNLYLAGIQGERTQAHEYIRWAMMETPCVPDAHELAHVDTFVVPQQKRTNLTETGLRRIERESKTFIFFDGGNHLAEMKIDARLLICGGSADARAEARDKLTLLQDGEIQEQVIRGKGTQPKKGQNAKMDAAVNEKKRSVQFVVSDEEEEKRRKRALRFA